MVDVPLTYLLPIASLRSSAISTSTFRLLVGGSDDEVEDFGTDFRTARVATFDGDCMLRLEGDRTVSGDTAFL